ncbi:hypothetical protein ACFW3D_18210 [Streptomyces sp. NPDC058864]
MPFSPYGCGPRSGYFGRRPRTWIALSREGAQALDAELRTLRALVLRLETPRPAPAPSDK